MPLHHVPVSDAEHAVFDRVRRAQGMSSVVEAVMWLAKRQLAKDAQRMTGRTRGPRLAAESGEHVDDETLLLAKRQLASDVERATGRIGLRLAAWKGRRL